MKLINMIVSCLMLVGFALAIPTVQLGAEVTTLKRELPKNAPSILANNGLPHPISDMVFVGTVGGHEVEFNGTIQQVLAHTQSLYPDIDLNLNGSASEISKRNKAPPPICCPINGQNFNPADYGTIAIGISYLQGVRGPCGVAARSCARISCSWASAIFLCNDNYYSIYPNCGYMASYAQDILNTCKSRVYDVGEEIACGQEFDTDNYNIVVRSDPC